MTCITNLSLSETKKPDSSRVSLSSRQTQPHLWGLPHQTAPLGAGLSRRCGAVSWRFLKGQDKAFRQGRRAASSFSLRANAPLAIRPEKGRRNNWGRREVIPNGRSCRWSQYRKDSPLEGAVTKHRPMRRKSRCTAAVESCDTQIFPLSWVQPPLPHRHRGTASIGVNS